MHYYKNSLTNFCKNLRETWRIFLKNTRKDFQKNLRGKIIRKIYEGSFDCIENWKKDFQKVCQINSGKNSRSSILVEFLEIYHNSFWFRRV